MKKFFSLFIFLGILGLFLFSGDFSLAYQMNTLTGIIPGNLFSSNSNWSERLFNIAVGAVTIPTDGITIQNPLEAQTFEGLVDNLIDFLFKIAIVLAPLMVVIGGILFVTSEGEPGKVAQAKNIILWTVIGFFILLFAKGILFIIEQILGVK